MNGNTTLRLDRSDEREFLHGVATPLATACLAIDMALETVQTRPNADNNELEPLLMVFEALQKIKSMLVDRRQILIDIGVPSARP